MYLFVLLGDDTIVNDNWESGSEDYDTTYNTEEAESHASSEEEIIRIVTYNTMPSDDEEAEVRTLHIAGLPTVREMPPEMSPTKVKSEICSPLLDVADGSTARGGDPCNNDQKDTDENDKIYDEVRCNMRRMTRGKGTVLSDVMGEEDCAVPDGPCDEKEQEMTADEKKGPRTRRRGKKKCILKVRTNKRANKKRKALLDVVKSEKESDSELEVEDVSVSSKLRKLPKRRAKRAKYDSDEYVVEKSIKRVKTDAVESKRRSSKRLARGNRRDWGDRIGRSDTSDEEDSVSGQEKELPKRRKGRRKTRNNAGGKLRTSKTGDMEDLSELMNEDENQSCTSDDSYRIESEESTASGEASDGSEGNLYNTENDSDQSYTAKPSKPITRKKKRSYICSLCQKSFLREETYNKHMNTHSHKVHRFQCKQCDKSFSSNRQLNIHEVEEHENRNHMCPVCGLTFAQDRDLQIHTPIHLGERPYVCGQCNVGFKLIHHLAQHMLMHTSEREYLCTTCGMGFKQNSNFHRHLRTHMNLRPHVCDVCHAGFKERTGLKRHRLIHNKVRPHVCNTCGSGFRRGDQLKFHKEKVHGDNQHWKEEDEDDVILCN